MDFSAREARVFYSHCEASVLQRAELPQKLQCHAFSMETTITENNILNLFPIDFLLPLDTALTHLWEIWGQRREKKNTKKE